jgi:hypothetical protein
LEADTNFGTKFILRLDCLSSSLAHPSSGGSEMSMTPLKKRNVMLALVLLLSTLVMTAFWIYFIIAKEPIRP